MNHGEKFELETDETQNLSHVEQAISVPKVVAITREVQDVLFDDSQSGLKLSFDKDLPTSEDYFFKFWDQEVMHMILDSMNKYSEILTMTKRPKQQYSRHASIRPFSMVELQSFLATCRLQSYI